MSKKGRSNNSHTYGAEKKKTAGKSKIPINLDDLIWDLDHHYSRISRIAKNTATDDKSFPKTYVILKDLARVMVEIMKLRGIESSEQSLAKLLSQVMDLKKQVEEVVKYAGK